MNKKTILSAIVVALILVGIGCWFIYSRQNNQNIVTTIDRDFTDQELSEIETKISDLKSKVDSNVSKEERYTTLLALGAEQHRIGRLVDARETFTAASKLLPDNPTPVGLKFIVEEAMQDYKAAKKTLEKGLELNPTSGLFWQQYIELLENHFEISKEQLDKLYQEGLQKTNNSPELLESYNRFKS
ncbi:hypothetical protein IPM19_00650 [bacterium]|nr:MAG: hypothetical protein IPM19_00650 [bacterium]